MRNIEGGQVRRAGSDPTTNEMQSGCNQAVIHLHIQPREGRNDMFMLMKW
jgi:hypothetical protein